MKFQFFFGFILLILFFIGMFVGLPYLLEKIKSTPLSFFSISKNSTTSTPGFFYSRINNWTNNSTSRSVINTGESLYKGKVRIGGVSSGKQINLSASYFEGAIKITGWRIKSAQEGKLLLVRALICFNLTPLLLIFGLLAANQLKLLPE